MRYLFALALTCLSIHAQVSTSIYRTKLTAAISSSDTTIPVQDTSELSAGMKFRLGTSGELLTIQSVDPTNIIVAARAAGAVSHAVDTGVMVLLEGAVDSIDKYRTGWVQLPPSACVGSVNGNLDSRGQEVVGGVHVLQVRTLPGVTNGHRYDCTIIVPRRASERIYITSVAFTYGVQESNLVTGSASLANGTINGATVFTYQDASLAGESSAPARADSGSISIAPSPVNLAAGTAGKWYTIRVTAGKPILVALGRVLQFTIVLNGESSSALTTYTRGLQVNYASW